VITLSSEGFRALAAKAAEGPQDIPLVEPPDSGLGVSLMKFDLHSCSEALGYRLAARLAVPVARAEPFWVTDRVTVPPFAAGPGRIGVFVKYLSPLVRISRDVAAERFPDATARARSAMGGRLPQWILCAPAVPG
jgi:hypothetical protein